MFAGERADFLKTRAVSIAGRMQAFLTGDDRPEVSLVRSTPPLNALRVGVRTGSSSDWVHNSRELRVGARTGSGCDWVLPTASIEVRSITRRVRLGPREEQDINFF